MGRFRNRAPSQKKIAEMTAEIRKGWSDAVREARRVVKQGTWIAPVVKVPAEIAVAMPYESAVQ